MWRSVDSTPKKGMDIVLAVHVWDESYYDYRFVHTKFHGWEDVYSNVLVPDKNRYIVGWREASAIEIEFYENQSVLDRPLMTRIAEGRLGT